MSTVHLKLCLFIFLFISLFFQPPAQKVTTIQNLCESSLSQFNRIPLIKTRKLNEVGMKISLTKKTALCHAWSTISWQELHTVFLEPLELMNKDPRLGCLPSSFDVANAERPIPHCCAECLRFWLRKQENLAQKTSTNQWLSQHFVPRNWLQQSFKEKGGSFKSKG